MANGQRQSPLELTIGVVGSHDLVERIMLSPAASPGPHRAAVGPAGNNLVPGAFPGGPGLARRLVAAAYRNEQEAGDKVLRLGPGIDAGCSPARCHIPTLAAQVSCTGPRPACRSAAVPCMRPC